MATLFEMGFLFLGLAFQLNIDNGNHLLGVTGNSGVIKCPGVPRWLYVTLLPLSPGKGEAGNASSERGLKALSCSQVRKC